VFTQCGISEQTAIRHKAKRIKAENITSGLSWRVPIRLNLFSRRNIRSTPSLNGIVRLAPREYEPDGAPVIGDRQVYVGVRAAPGLSDCLSAVFLKPQRR
jgi:hypothetical protein